ncbi:ABC transporter permease [Microlunatus soli]|uniref:ABC-2 type transport system permease protein n=1 Tax=Microlunatus soli TaxID=630515 RepID=A0A1H1QQW5_9ACTN|nr:hypothetical protein [Microlunatus soli]SDS25858.1 ABC-2 type transport system permease protein [Microlunatus soli]
MSDDAGGGGLQGTAQLIKFTLRRDRLPVPAWAMLAILLPWGIASGTLSLYPTPAALADYAIDALRNGAEVAMRGIIYSPTSGGVTAWGAGMSSALVAAFASALLIIRHTRAEEDSGRSELLGATSVGRSARLAAPLIVIGAANLVIGAVMAVPLIASGLPVPGSVLLGLSTGGVGLVITAASAVIAQWVGTAGQARSVSILVIAGFFVIRAVGDSTVGWLSWLSPFGWARLSRAYAGDRWWVLGLFAATAAGLMIIAGLVQRRRDIGSGLLQPRPGPAVATRWLNSIAASTWRTHRAGVIIWAVAFAVVGALIGAAAAGASDQLGAMFSGSDALLSFTFLILSQAATAFGIISVGRLRAEELDGHGELLLPAAGSRWRWAASHLVVGIVGPGLLLLAAGVTAGLTSVAAGGEDATSWGRVLASALIWLPAVWIITAIAMALVGLWPRSTPGLPWALLIIALLLELGHEFGLLGDAVLALSPYSHIPRLLLGQAVSAAVLAVSVIIAAALCTAGLVGIRNRDLGR